MQKIYPILEFGNTKAAQLLIMPVESRNIPRKYSLIDGLVDADLLNGQQDC